MSETGKKFWILTISLKKMRILGILGHFWPVMASVSVINGPNEYIFPSSEWNEWDWRKNFKKQWWVWKTDFGHFWPVFGLLWPRFECLMVQMSIFVLLLSGMSETDKKISNNDDKVEKTPILAIFGHFWPFLAYFWPVMAPVWVLKHPNEYIFPSSAWNEWDWLKILNNNN